MRRLRISRVRKEVYVKILIAIEFRDSGESEIRPAELEDWRRLIVRFSLARDLSSREWIVAVRKLEDFPG